MGVLGYITEQFVRIRSRLDDATCRWQIGVVFPSPQTELNREFVREGVGASAGERNKKNAAHAFA